MEVNNRSQASNQNNETVAVILPTGFKKIPAVVSTNDYSYDDEEKEYDEKFEEKIQKEKEEDMEINQKIEDTEARIIEIIRRLDKLGENWKELLPSDTGDTENTTSWPLLGHNTGRSPSPLTLSPATQAPKATTGNGGITPASSPEAGNKSGTPAMRASNNTASASNSAATKAAPSLRAITGASGGGGGGTTAAPSPGATTGVSSSGGGTTAAPSPGATTGASGGGGGTTTAISPGATTGVSSGGGGTTAAPSPGATTGASGGGGGTTTAISPGATTGVSSGGGGTTAAPSPGATTGASGGGGGTTAAISPGATTGAFGGGGGTTAAPSPGATTGASGGVGGGTTAAPSPGPTTGASGGGGGTTAAPSPGATIGASGGGGTTAAPSPGATSGASGGGGTTAAPSPGATSDALGEDASPALPPEPTPVLQTPTGASGGGGGTTAVPSPGATTGASSEDTSPAVPPQPTAVSQTPAGASGGGGGTTAATSLGATTGALPEPTRVLQTPAGASGGGGGTTAMPSPGATTGASSEDASPAVPPQPTAVSQTPAGGFTFGNAPTPVLVPRPAPGGGGSTAARTYAPAPAPVPTPVPTPAPVLTPPAGGGFTFGGASTTTPTSAPAPVLTPAAGGGFTFGGRSGEGAARTDAAAASVVRPSIPVVPQESNQTEREANRDNFAYQPEGREGENQNNSGSEQNITTSAQDAPTVPRPLSKETNNDTSSTASGSKSASQVLPLSPNAKAAQTNVAEAQIRNNTANLPPEYSKQRRKMQQAAKDNKDDAESSLHKAQTTAKLLKNEIKDKEKYKELERLGDNRSDEQRNEFIKLQKKWKSNGMFTSSDGDKQLTELQTTLQNHAKNAMGDAKWHDSNDKHVDKEVNKLTTTFGQASAKSSQQINALLQNVEKVHKTTQEKQNVEHEDNMLQADIENAPQSKRAQVQKSADNIKHERQEKLVTAAAAHQSDALGGENNAKGKLAHFHAEKAKINVTGLKNVDNMDINQDEKNEIVYKQLHDQSNKLKSHAHQDFFTQSKELQETHENLKNLRANKKQYQELQQLKRKEKNTAKLENLQKEARIAAKHDAELKKLRTKQPKNAAEKAKLKQLEMPGHNRHMFKNRTPKENREREVLNAKRNRTSRDNNRLKILNETGSKLKQINKLNTKENKISLTERAHLKSLKTQEKKGEIHKWTPQSSNKEKALTQKAHNLLQTHKMEVQHSIDTDLKLKKEKVTPHTGDIKDNLLTKLKNHSTAHVDARKAQTKYKNTQQKHESLMQKLSSSHDHTKRGFIANGLHKLQIARKQRKGATTKPKLTATLHTNKKRKRGLCMPRHKLIL